MRTFGYYRPANFGQQAKDHPERAALLAFGASQGVDLELRLESDQQRPSKVMDRQVGSVTFRNLQQGDLVVIPSLGSAFDYPSDLLEVSRKVSGRGAMLRILGLADRGPIEIVGELASAFVGLEQEVARLTSELEIVQRDAEERLAEATREVVRTLGTRFNTFVDGLPSIGDVRAQRPEQKAGEHIGVALERRAAKLGLSQSEIARRLDIPLSSVNRAIRLGEGHAVASVSRLLWPEAKPAADSTTPGSGAGAAVSQAMGG